MQPAHAEPHRFSLDHIVWNISQHLSAERTHLSKQKAIFSYPMRQRQSERFQSFFSVRCAAAMLNKMIRGKKKTKTKNNKNKKRWRRDRWERIFADRDFRFWLFISISKLPMKSKLILLACGTTQFMTFGISQIGINCTVAVSIFVLTHSPWIDKHSKNENQFEFNRATVRRLLFDFGMYIHGVQFGRPILLLV